MCPDPAFLMHFLLHHSCAVSAPQMPTGPSLSSPPQPCWQTLGAGRGTNVPRAPWGQGWQLLPPSSNRPQGEQVCEAAAEGCPLCCRGHTGQLGLSLALLQMPAQPGSQGRMLVLSAAPISKVTEQPPSCRFLNLVPPSASAPVRGSVPCSGGEGAWDEGWEPPTGTLDLRAPNFYPAAPHNYPGPKSPKLLPCSSSQSSYSSPWPFCP